MPTNRTEIEEKISSILTTILDPATPDIRPGSKLIQDLGLGSLDLATLVYEIEEAFEIEIETEVLFPQRMLRDPRFVNDGVLTLDGVNRLKEQFHFTTLPEIPEGTPVSSVTQELMTVGFLTDYVHQLVEAGRQGA